MNYAIVTYGCQMNLHESEKIAGILRSVGYEKETPLSEADIIVFNTCCIRENAENHAFGNIGALKKLKASRRGMIIAVGGCMAQEQGKAELLARKFPFIDIIFGTHNLSELAQLIERKKSEKRVVSLYDDRAETEDGAVPCRTSYPNAWVNITYGCNNFCSYCIVPYVRGREKSRSADLIEREARSLIAEGYREITLLGQNVNSYRDGAVGFPALLERIASIEGKFRLRFMTSHPKDFSAEVVAVMKRHPDKIPALVHLPAQSGSDRILRLMNRKYTRAEYLEKVALLKREIPHAEVTTDLIVAFPSETEAEFEETLSLVREADFSSAFTFVYSPRTGTKAAGMAGQIPEEVAKERITRLVAAVNENTRRKSETCVGQTLEVLAEDYDEKRGMYLGREPLGRMGYFTSDKNCIGSFVRLHVTRANGVSLYGEIE